MFMVYRQGRWQSRKNAIARGQWVAEYTTLELAEAAAREFTLNSSVHFFFASLFVPPIN